MRLQMTDNLLPYDGSTPGVRWLRSFNWAMPTLLVVVIGDATPVSLTGTLYVSFIILFGLIVNAMVLGVMADRLTDTNSNRAVHRSNMDMVERWLLLSGVGDDVVLCVPWPAWPLMMRTRRSGPYLTTRAKMKLDLVEREQAVVLARVSVRVRVRQRMKQHRSL